MSKVITFSRVFPKYHPKAGQPTYFVEQIYNSLFSKNNLMDYPKGLEINDTIMGVKKHTIRIGNRWKVGDKFSPRVWSGKPYNSKQIILCDDVKIEKIYNIKIEVTGNFYTPYIDGKNVCQETMKKVAMNDGLSLSELYKWFNESFEGQIICWSNAVSYV